MVKGLTKKFYDDPIGMLLLLLVIAATALREGEVVPSPWDTVIGVTISMIFAYGIVSRPPTKK